MGISHILDRKLGDLSGGELQRVAICATLLKEADVYFFDEPSSYLDIYERMRMVGVVRELAEKGKRVLVVEHDLAILDVLCDLIHVIYGERSAYGILLPPDPPGLRLMHTLTASSQKRMSGLETSLYSS